MTVPAFNATASTCGFVFVFVVATTTATGEEKTALQRVFSGIQTMFHSSHPKKRGYGHQGLPTGVGTITDGNPRGQT